MAAVVTSSWSRAPAVFLGAAIANSARAAGYAVRVLIRTSSPRTNIDPHDQVVIGDLRDRASWPPPCAACAIWSTPPPIIGFGHHHPTTSCATMWREPGP